MQSVLGQNHQYTLTIKANLVTIYQIQGRWHEAKMLNEQVLKGRVEVPGHGHPHTLASAEDLMRIYQVNIADEHVQ